MTQGRSNLLAGALEVEGALPELTELDLNSRLAPDGLVKVAGALKGGAAPLLRKLRLALYKRDGLESITGMLEARASVPGSKRLEHFEGG